MPTRVTPLTLLLAVLAVLAAWAVIGSIVVLAGVGGRYQLLPDEAAETPPIPDTGQVREQVAFAPALLTEASDRPLFSPDRRPGTTRLDDDQGGEPAQLIVTSIVITPQMQAALVRRADDTRTVRVGIGEEVDGSPGWRLRSLQSRQADFDGPDGPVTLELRVFDGQGGEPPTRIVQTQATTNGPRARRETTAEPTRARATSAAAASSPAQQAADGDAVEAADDGQADAADDVRRDAPPPQLTPEEQAQAIRQRIEERREQLRQRAQRSPDELE